MLVKGKDRVFGMNNLNSNEIYHICKGWYHWDLAGQYAQMGREQAWDHLEVAEFHFAIAGEDENKIQQHTRVIVKTYFKNATTEKAPIKKFGKSFQTCENGECRG